MKIVFFGTPDYVVPVVSALHKKYVTGPGKSPIAAVVTQNPKPTGRKQIVEYSPVDKWAHERGISTFYEPADLIENNIEADLGILASYGKIIPKSVINLFPHGILVIHPSLLPKYRGASPVQSAIMEGETQTGVTIFKMDERVDHGPIISQSKEAILENDTFESLRSRLFDKSCNILIELMEPYMKNKILAKAQDESKATYTKIISRQDGFVDMAKDDPAAVERKLRALTPWPGIWTLLRTSITEEKARRLKILSGYVEDGKFVPDEVQMEGRTPARWKQFVEAYPGLVFESKINGE